MHCSRDRNSIADCMARRRDDDLYGCINVTRLFPFPPSYCMDLYHAECIPGPDVASMDHNGM